ncbi:hypothetical protein CFC21_084058 [Triticum aestivum]|uniref:Uncharacterized protein n=2 Tax=Triticum aestivum TaxID=4565 RepID=A0A9R1I9G0_WHEAT|nr:hypothetical protein CFC21_084058 [Triticum aestivum]
MAILCREIVTSFVVDFRAFLKMLVGKIWRKEEKSIPRWSRCVSDAMVLFSWKHQSLAMLLYPCQYIDKPAGGLNEAGKGTENVDIKWVTDGNVVSLSIMLAINIFCLLRQN